MMTHGLMTVYGLYFFDCNRKTAVRAGSPGKLLTTPFQWHLGLGGGYGNGQRRQLSSWTVMYYITCVYLKHIPLSFM